MITTLLFGLISMPCSAELRDPTQPAYPLSSADDTASGSGSADLVLSAIWISAHSRRATINGIIAKQGQTIEVKQTSTLNPEPATLPKTANIDGKDNERINKTNRPPQENSADLLGNMIAPLLSPPIGSVDIPQRQGQRPRQQANTVQDPASMQSPNAIPKPVRSSTVKIIGIHKNSVTIDQDGERKTLQLVQSPYKTQ